MTYHSQQVAVVEFTEPAVIQVALIAQSATLAVQMVAVATTLVYILGFYSIGSSISSQAMADEAIRSGIFDIAYLVVRYLVVTVAFFVGLILATFC